MSVIGVLLLAAAVLLLAVAEWPRIAARTGMDLAARRRARRRSRLKVVRDEPDESDDFARSVERDLASLPTYDPRDADKRR